MSHFGHDWALFHKGIAGISIFPFLNIIIGIHEDDISYYNVSGRSLLEDLKIKLYKVKEEAQKAFKITGDPGNQ